MSDRAGRPLRLAVAVLLLAIPAVAQDPEPWDEELWNPQPLSDDLVLPLPCGGGMVFRPVEVPSSGPVDDRRLLLGGTDDEGLGWAEAARFEELAAGFTDPAAPARHLYWIAKYETTALQYAALEPAAIAGEACPETSRRGRLPAVEVTWAEAAAAAERWAGWLAATHPDALPREEALLGYPRLPTEAEWEYATRGGVAVAAEAFRARLFPMPEGTARYVWFQGGRSAAGRLQPIGLLAANPLGLHDALGNAAEMVLEPFRLAREGRLHGQAGGTTVKGGSFLTPESAIRSSLRQELPPLREDGPTRLRDVGFRLAIAVPVVTSPERLGVIRAGLADLGVAEPGAGEDSLDGLSAAVAGIADAPLRSRLEQLTASLRAAEDDRRTRAERTARSLIGSGAYFGALVSVAARTAALRRQIIASLEAAPGEPRDVTALREALARDERDLQVNLDRYLEAVIVAAENFEAPVIAAQRAILLEELQGADQAPLAPFTERFQRHAAAYREDGLVDRDAWLAELQQ